MKILVKYADGSQKVELDDGQVVILSSPYPNGERKITSENGKDLGSLTSQYPNGHKYARMLDGSEYDVSEKTHWFSGSQETWQKYKEGRIKELNSTEKEQIQQATQSELISVNSVNPDDNESVTYDEDIANEINSENETSGFYSKPKEIEIDKDEEEQIKEVKKEINDANRDISWRKRMLSQMMSKYNSAKSNKRRQELKYYVNACSYEVDEAVARKELYTEQLRVLQEQQRLKQKQKLSEHQAEREEYLANEFVSDLKRYLDVFPYKGNVRFSEFQITPPLLTNGRKDKIGTEALIQAMEKFYTMSGGYPKGWKYAEYIFGKMGLTTSEFISARKYLQSQK